MLKNSLLLISLCLTGCEDCQPRPFQVAGESKETPEDNILSGYSFTVTAGELPNPPPRFLEPTKAVYRLLEQNQQPFESYEESIPRANDARFKLIPIKGGSFLMGASRSDVNHRPDELPQRKVELSDFWMAETETTWAMYQNFINQKDARGKFIGRDEFGFRELDEADVTEVFDIISGPSFPYLPAQEGPTASDNERTAMQQPAIGVSRHAALKFCQWLSAQTGHFYRLPTEAEWEYACRAGTTSSYSFGDDPSQVNQYAWYYLDEENYLEHPMPVGGKKANPWGLFDMHGNVSEWTLDTYLPNSHHRKSGVKNPISFSTQLHQGVARGGNFDDDPEFLRSAARAPASRDWNNQDPQSPPSIWYNSSAFWLGFRVVRPRKLPSIEEAHVIWNLDSGKFWNY